MFIIEPLFGLCNRMQTLDSAIKFSQQNQFPLQIVWVRNRDLNCRFDDLFVVPPEVNQLFQPSKPFFKQYSGPSLSLGIPESFDNQRINNFPKLSNLIQFLNQNQYHQVSGVLLNSIRRINKVLLYHYSYKKVIYADELNRLLEQNFNFQELTGFESVYIQTYRRFFQLESPFYQFKPTPDLQDTIDSYAHTFHDSTVGVHIRRTDHRRSILNSPTHKFIEFMQAEIEQNSNTRFFLATDSPEDERLLKKTFPGRIIIHPKQSLDRNSPQAIQDALVDLFCLSKTKKLFGSYWSSFSKVATQLGNIEFVVVMTDP